ncbi:hypothetical protein QYF61_014345 [Mycteria americana]|uniref:Uncharacterized protein n=1 Tax=Mycteria americana TaxID=33587 RepID=A0AAN7S2P5_MYCAM|nr:hypothetical protein QYF61_014345 [Mycteria americana]
MEIDLATTPASSLKTLGRISLGPMDYIQVPQMVLNLIFSSNGGIKSSCALRKMSLSSCQLSSTPLFLKGLDDTFYLACIPQDHEFQQGMTAAGEATTNLDLSNKFLCISEQQVQITESQNRIGWKRPLRSSSPTVKLTLPRPPRYHVPKHLIQTSLKYFQGWQLNHCPGQPVPMLDNPFSEVKFPNIQTKPTMAQLEARVQLEAISSRPITSYLGEETDPHLSTTSFQVAVESKKVSPQPPFLRAKKPQFPQPLLIRLVL